MPIGKDAAEFQKMKEEEIANNLLNKKDKKRKLKPKLPKLDKMQETAKITELPPTPAEANEKVKSFFDNLDGNPMKFKQEEVNVVDNPLVLPITKQTPYFSLDLMNPNEPMVSADDVEWIKSSDFDRKKYSFLLPDSLQDCENLSDDSSGDSDEEEEDEPEPKKKKKKITKKKKISNYVSSSIKKIHANMCMANKKAIRAPTKTIDIVAVMILLVENFPKTSFTLERFYSAKLHDINDYRSLYPTLLEFTVIYRYFPASFNKYLDDFYNMCVTPQVLSNKSCQKLIAHFIQNYPTEFQNCVRAIQDNFTFISESFTNGQKFVRRNNLYLSSENYLTKKERDITDTLDFFQNKYTTYDVYNIHRGFSKG